MRLKEVDRLYKMKCEALSSSNSQTPKSFFIELQNQEEKLIIAKTKLEDKLGINSLIEKLENIKDAERINGEKAGKKRQYFKKGSIEYERKQELKLKIDYVKQNEDLMKINRKIRMLEAEKREFSFTSPKFDSSIDEQFVRISEYMNHIIKKTNSYFEKQNNETSNNITSDINLEIDIPRLANHYLSKSTTYNSFIKRISGTLFSNLSESECSLFKISINAMLSHPQGFIGSISEEHIIKLLVMIGEQVENPSDKQYLRNYYLYRTNKLDKLDFPKSGFIQNLIVFFMKYQGYEQMNKFILKKDVKNKHLTFIIWGCFIGFANLPKTFTAAYFSSKNLALFDEIDEFINSNILT